MTNKKLERLLVIEDTPCHLEEAKKFLGEILGLKTEYATTWEDAESKIEMPERTDDNPIYVVKQEEQAKRMGFKNMDEYWDKAGDAALKEMAAALKDIPPGIVVKPKEILVDGVITDLFFPISRNIKREINEGPNGLVVAATCQRLGIPYVICTAGHHHGSKYNWANYMHRAMKGPEIIDRGGSELEGEAPHKNWEAAYKKLIGEVTGQD